MRNEEIGTDNGSAVIDPAGPVVANAPGWWRIIYTAGPRGIDVGGSVRFEIPYGFTPPQPHWHGDAGHVTATCSRQGATLRITVEEPPVRRDPETFYYVTRWGRHIFVQVLGEPLREGDTIALSYGRHPGFQPGAYAQHFAGPAEFTVATDVDATRSARFSGYTLIAQQPTLEVLADEPTHFECCAPTLATVGRPIELTILARDYESNTVPPEQGIIEFSGNEAGADVDLLGATPLSRRARVTFSAPGVKVVRVTELERDLTGVCNPVIVADQPPALELFWGDIHGHTILSDGLKSPEQYYEFGRDEAALDFCAIADHSQYLSDEDWEHIMRVTRRFNRPGEYVTLLGYELSVNARDREEYGDKCLYYPGDEGPLLRATDINRTGYCYISRFADQWKSHGAMMVLHQHAHGSGSFYDPDLVRLCEVYSIWGGSESLDCTRPLLPARDRDFTGHLGVDLLARGWRLGFMAASDDHAGRPGKTDWLRVRRAYPGGLAAVLAPELTREALWDALWNRRCYGTSGARIYLDFRVDGALMGSVLDASHTTPEIEVNAVGTEAVILTEVLRSGEVIHVHTGISEAAHLTFADDRRPKGPCCYHVRVTQSDGEMAWSSPIWIEQ